ncbi:MAG: triple tyrosine motif-containing protein [Candidatus Solibacter sp.]|nr:triple tyrosine motif-containing protein [Candidatus Solibacter sp.]
MIRVNYKLAALALSAFGALLPAFAQGPAPANTLSGVLNSPGSLQARLRFEHLTTADGLSNDSVFSILQDRRGFMWFGTQGGLNRYDGYRITQYRHDPKNPNSLGDDFVQILFEDSRGGIWSGRAFLSRFDPDTETFTRYNLPEGGTGNRATSVWGIAEDRQGFVWVVTTSQHPLYRYDPRTDKFSVQDLGKDAPSSQGFMTLQATADGILWMGRDNTLVRFDPATLTSSSYHPDASAADGGIRISAVALDRKGGLWLASRPGAPNFFDPVTGEFSRKGTSGARPNLPPTGIDSIISPGPDGTMWVGTSMGGLKVFDPDTGASGSLRHDPADPRSLSRNEVLSIAGDREGNLWVGVKGGGVNLLSARSTAFGAWRRSPDDPNGLSDDNVRAISGDRTGSIWLGTYDGGLNRLEPKSGAFVHYRSDPRNPKGLDNDRVYSIYEDRAGTLWAGTVRGINRLDRKSGSFSHVWPVPLEVQNGPIYFFLEDRTGRFWHGGGRLFDRDTGISTFVGNAGGLSMHEDRAGDLWFASLGGLEKMDAGGKRHQIDVSSSGSGGPASVQVNLFHEDGAGILWLATETGLVRLDPKTEKYTTYTTHEGLPDNVVQCILSDRAGNLWLSTNNGLSVFNPREISFRNYHESDGLQGEQFNRKACFQNAAGLMYFGGIHGFNAFDPSQVGSGSAVPPPLVLTEFQIHGRTVPVRRGSLLPRPIWEMETLRLSYQENGFTFEFAALSYASPGRTRYRFRLAGLEDEWTSVDSRHRFARYTDLRPADYKFQVQASTDGRTWDHSGNLDLAPVVADSLEQGWGNTGAGRLDLRRLPLAGEIAARARTPARGSRGAANRRTGGGAGSDRGRQPGRASRQPRQEHLPVQHEPRITHAAQLHPGLL